jgi:hypothetical protein
MPHLASLNYFCTDGVIESIYNNQNCNKVGIISNINIINENNKCVGRVALIQTGIKKKLDLDTFVEFNKDKIIWRSSPYNDESFYIIDQYWVKNYLPDPKINVPTTIYNTKTQFLEIEYSKLTFGQFMKRRFFEETKNISYGLILAYENFTYMLNETKDYYLSLNSTVKHYHIKQEELEKIRSKLNHIKNRIKKEWNDHMKIHISKEYSTKYIQELYKNYKTNKKSGVQIMVKNDKKVFPE